MYKAIQTSLQGKQKTKPKVYKEKELKKAEGTTHRVEEGINKLKK